MPTTIGGMAVATTGSGHVSPGPAPATSLAPPTPPAGPVPAPFVYICRSSSAQDTSSKLTIAGDPVLVIMSHMAVEQPGNIIAKTTGGDVVTHVADMRAPTCSGAANAKAEGKKICRTGDSVYLNVPTGTSKVSQLQGILIGAADLAAMSPSDQLKYAAQWLGLIDPVSAASGSVFENDTDLVVRGIVPIELARCYDSLRAREIGPLGRGGWTHSLAQWIEIGAEHLVLRESFGRSLVLPIAGLDAGVVHYRRFGLRVARAGDRLEVFSFATRLTRTFEPLERGGQAVLRSTRDANGNTVHYDYEGALLVAARGPSKRDLRFAYDAAGRVVRAEVWARGAAQQHVDYAYDDDGQLAIVRDATGATQRFAYDAHRRLIEKTLPSGLRFHYRYDPESGRCVRGWGDGGLHRGAFHYDLEKHTTTLTDTPTPRVVEWDERGAILADRSANGAKASTTTYDDDMLPIGFEDAAGNTIELERDELGFVLSSVGPGAAKVDLEVDDRGLVTKRTLGGRVTDFTYDDRGALIGVRYPSGLWMSLGYDGRGRLASVAGPDGTLASFDYDEHDDVIVERGPFGEPTTFERDPLGRITARVDALGRRIAMTYDAVGRKIEHVAPDGAVTKMEHDALGLPSKTIDANGGVLEQLHAGVHSLVRQTQEDGSVWDFELDSVERVRAIINAKRERWEVKYDRAGRVVEERPFDGRVLRFQWGANGALTKIEHNDGTARLFTNDALGRRVVDWTEHSVIEIERDEHGRCTKATLTEPLGTIVTELVWDDAGRLVAESHGGRAIRWEYGARNEIAARTLPDGRTTRYRYDLVGRLASVEHEGRALTITRDAVGREIARRFEPCAVDITSEYDVCDRLVRTRVLKQPPFPGDPRPLLAERTFEWDKRGWLLRVDDSHGGSVRYEHDRIGQLLEAQATTGREVFRYDGAGSVIARTDRDHAMPPPWKTLAGNVLVETDEATYEVDDERRRTKRVDAKTGETTEYLWDCRSRLREVRFTNGARVIYVYDAFGRRVRKDWHDPLPEIESGAPAPVVRSTHYLWTGDYLVAEVDPEGRERVFVHEPGTHEPLMQEEGGEVLAFVVDHLGTPKELLDESGAIAWRASHTAFGAPIEESSSRVSTPLRFQGHYHDRETGLSYARNRYFDATTARWLSPDPFGFLGGRNLQAWNGNPTVHADPLGLYCAIGNPAWDGAFRACPRIPPKPGYYDVIVHGEPTQASTMDPHGTWHDMSPQQVAALIRAQSDYVPGTPVRLISCNSGRDPDGFAQQVSNELNAPVLAPTRMVTPANYQIDPATGMPVWSPTPGTGPASAEPGLFVWERDVSQPCQPFIPNDPGSWVPFNPR